MTSLWNRLRELPLRIDSYRLEGRELVANSGFRRLTTEVCLEGADICGRGEEVGWDSELQQKFRKRGGYLELTGEHSLNSFGELLDELELSPDKPPVPDWQQYRRWAFESAALDLALRQNGLGLATAIGREVRTLHFGVSLSPRNFSDIERRLELHANMRFKLDAVPEWTQEFCLQLAKTRAVDVVDFKGAYVGTAVDVEANLDLYKRVLSAIPDVLVEDPHNQADILELLRATKARVAWDAPIHHLDDVAKMPLVPNSLNIKPSRFGKLKHLFATYEACEARGLAMYGGGQFELGVGRRQIQLLAGLFHAEGPNDVAPRGYHQLESKEARPSSPHPLQPTALGFDTQNR